MEAHPDVDGVKYLKEHFKDVVGKVFSPYQTDNIYSLALDMSYPESQELIDNSKRISMWPSADWVKNHRALYSVQRAGWWNYQKGSL